MQEFLPSNCGKEERAKEGDTREAEEEIKEDETKGEEIEESVNETKEEETEEKEAGNEANKNETKEEEIEDSSLCRQRCTASGAVSSRAESTALSAHCILADAQRNTCATASCLLQEHGVHLSSHP